MTTNYGQYSVQLPDGQELHVDLAFENGEYVAVVGGQKHRLRMEPGHNGAVVVGVDASTYQLDDEHLRGQGSVTSLADVSARDAGLEALKSSASQVPPGLEPEPEAVASPLTGRVIQVPVVVGQMVERGQTMVIIEAMKMENRIAAPRAGRINSILVAEGAVVRRGVPLLSIREL